MAVILQWIMAPSPPKVTSPKKASGPLPRARNRPIVETPVVISDGSGSDGASTPQPPKAAVPGGAAISAAVQESAPVLLKEDRTSDPMNPVGEPAVGLLQPTAPFIEAVVTDDAESAWAAFVAEGIKSVEEAGRTTPTPNVPAAARVAEPEDALGAPDLRWVPFR